MPPSARQPAYFRLSSRINRLVAIADVTVDNGNALGSSVSYDLLVPYILLDFLTSYTCSTTAYLLAI